MRKYVVEFDDLCDATVERLNTLCLLKEQYPDLRVTLFTIPQRTSDATIEIAKSCGDWLYLAPHGWWHTRGECMSWQPDNAIAYLQAAAERGIDAPMFRAPAWLLDQDTYEACNKLGYVVCDHKDYKINIKGTRVYRYNDPTYRIPKVTPIHGHLTNTPAVTNFIDDMIKDGRLTLTKVASYLTPIEASVEVNFTERTAA